MNVHYTAKSSDKDAKGERDEREQARSRKGAILAWRLRMALVEHAALCRLVAGGKAHALHEIARAAHLLTQAPEREYCSISPLIFVCERFRKLESKRP